MAIITTQKLFKTVIEKTSAVLLHDGKRIYFVTPYGEEVQYHLDGCDHVNNPKYTKPIGATEEPVNYKL